MKKKLKVIVDMDGVLVDLVTSWSAWLNNKHGLDLEHGDFLGKFEESPKIIASGLTRSQVKRPFFIKGFWRSLPPNADALEFFPLIIKEFDVAICTAPHWQSPTSAYEKKKWIEHYFGDIPFIATESKYAVRGDIIIDDWEKNLIECKEAGMKTMCFVQPWSKADIIQVDYKVHSFSEAYDVLTKM